MILGTQKRYIRPTHFELFGKTAAAVPDSTVSFAYQHISDSRYAPVDGHHHTDGTVEYSLGH